MDLCFGDKKGNVYYGVLIRSIYEVEGNRVITGPSLTVDEIISNFNCKTVKEFMYKNQMKNFKDKDSLIKLEEKEW